jgi:hypothetical protein
MTSFSRAVLSSGNHVYHKRTSGPRSQRHDQIPQLLLMRKIGLPAIHAPAFAKPLRWFKRKGSIIVAPALSNRTRFHGPRMLGD